MAATTIRCVDPRLVPLAEALALIVIGRELPTVLENASHAVKTMGSSIKEAEEACRILASTGARL